MSKFFVYDLNGDIFSFYEEEAKAREDFLASVEAIEEIANDPNESYDADDFDICWGTITGRIKILEEENGMTITTENPNEPNWKDYPEKMATTKASIEAMTGGEDD